MFLNFMKIRRDSLFGSTPVGSRLKTKLFLEISNVTLGKNYCSLYLFKIMSTKKLGYVFEILKRSKNIWYMHSDLLLYMFNVY